MPQRTSVPEIKKREWHQLTCKITESASITKMPDEMKRGKNIPVQEAIAASAPPRARDPVSPMNTEAL